MDKTKNTSPLLLASPPKKAAISPTSRQGKKQRTSGGEEERQAGPKVGPTKASPTGKAGKKPQSEKIKGSTPAVGKVTESAAFRVFEAGKSKDKGKDKDKVKDKDKEKEKDKDKDKTIAAGNEKDSSVVDKGREKSTGPGPSQTKTMENKDGGTETENVNAAPEDGVRNGGTIKEFETCEGEKIEKFKGEDFEKSEEQEESEEQKSEQREKNKEQETADGIKRSSSTDSKGGSTDVIKRSSSADSKGETTDVIKRSSSADSKGETTDVIKRSSSADSKGETTDVIKRSSSTDSKGVATDAIKRSSSTDGKGGKITSLAAGKAQVIEGTGKGKPPGKQPTDTGRKTIPQTKPVKRSSSLSKVNTGSTDKVNKDSGSPVKGQKVILKSPVKKISVKRSESLTGGTTSRRKSSELEDDVFKPESPKTSTAPSVGKKGASGSGGKRPSAQIRKSSSLRSLSDRKSSTGSVKSPLPPSPSVARSARTAAKSKVMTSSSTSSLERQGVLLGRATSIESNELDISDASDLSLSTSDKHLPPVTPETPSPSIPTTPRPTSSTPSGSGLSTPQTPSSSIDDPRWPPLTPPVVWDAALLRAEFEEFAAMQRDIGDVSVGPEMDGTEAARAAKERMRRHWKELYRRGLKVILPGLGGGARGVGINTRTFFFILF